MFFFDLTNLDRIVANLVKNLADLASPYFLGAGPFFHRYKYSTYLAFCKSIEPGIRRNPGV
jgi:hypothetical protein